jgi:hypothetical protein
MEILSVCGENAAWCDSDPVFVYRNGGKLRCIYARIKLDPEYKSALRPRHPYVGRKIASDRAAKALYLVGEKCSNFSEVRVVGAVLQEFGDCHLCNRRATQRLVCFKLQNRITETARRNPANS